MKITDYMICSRCIIDSTDPEITFDEHGVCSHCHYFDNVRSVGWDRTTQALVKLDSLISEIKSRRLKNKYDCMIGLSGGVDSSYLAYFLAHRYSLRILAVHVDAGWNSPEAVSNIENLVKSLKLDLYTYVVDWEEMKNVQVAFLKSEVVNQDTPQDHAYFSALNMVARKFGIKDFLVGFNLQSESILPRSWQGVSASDSVHFNYICRKFMGRNTRGFPRMSFFDSHIYMPLIFKLRKISPLNYIDYEKDRAKAVISEKVGWRDYGVKHGESKFTKFFQCYYLPRKFSFDKRRAHLSSLMLAGEMSRDEAMVKIAESVYQSDLEMRLDFQYVAKKLGMKEVELSELCQPVSCIASDSIPTEENLLKFGRRIKKFLRL